MPLRGLALALAYYDSSLGLAAVAAHAAALRQGAGAWLSWLRACVLGALHLPDIAGMPPKFLWAPASSCQLLPLCAADGEAAAEQWEPVISPLLLQACWQQLEASWAASSVADGEALRRYTSSGALAAAPADGAAGADHVCSAAGMLGAFLQLHSVPPAAVLQQTAGRVQEMLQGAALQDASAAATAAAAMLCATHRGLGLPAAQALAAALLH